MDSNETNLLENLYLNAPINNAESDFATAKDEEEIQTAVSQNGDEVDKEL